MRFRLSVFVFFIGIVSLQAQSEHEFTTGLAAADCHRYGRQAIVTDQLAYQLATETFQKPEAGGKLFTDDDGADVSWKAIETDSTGKFRRQSTQSFPCAEENIPRYKAMRTNGAPDIDGRLTEEIWKAAPRSSNFVDLVSGTETHLDTRAAVVWDDEYLYVAYWIEEPDVRATLTERDAPVYRDNDVELFIAGSDGYYEFEINAYGTIYEVLFFWEEAFQRKGYADMPEFDRNKKGVAPFNGVGYKSHPRGKRIGFWNWDFPGLKKAVYIDGTLNDSNKADKGWTVELALPWSGLSVLAQGDGRTLPPKDGDVWRMDFSRFNTYKAPPPAKDSGGWAWSSHGVWDSHVPECFTYVEFAQ